MEKTGHCWTWIKAKDKDGYGVFRLKGRRRIKAHRFAYEKKYGPIGLGLVIRHKCDNPACVNPDHLIAGTHLDNKQDAVKRGRDCRGEAHHKARLSERDVLDIRASDLPGATIAADYGVTKENVYAIRSRKIWRHL